MLLNKNLTPNFKDSFLLPIVCRQFIAKFAHSDVNEYLLSLSNCKMKLPRANAKLLQSLEEAGISDIRDISIDFKGLNSTQQRVHDCLVNNRFHLGSELPQALQQLLVSHQT